MQFARSGKKIALALLVVLASGRFAAWAAEPTADDPKAVKQEDGKYLDKDGIATFRVAPDGTVDFYTYAGFVRYSANCLQCHGPDGMGSSYAPALVNSLKTLSYEQFLTTVANGKKNVNAAQTLFATISGAGAVTYYGMPQVSQRITGVGSVKQG